jgi:hypothetical protein
MTICLGIFRIAFNDIMISVQHIKPIAFIKQGHQPKCVTVGIYDIIDLPVFPQLISIADLDVRITVFIIIVKSGKIYILIIGEIIIPITISSVAVAHYDNSGGIIKEYLF